MNRNFCISCVLFGLIICSLATGALASQENSVSSVSKIERHLQQWHDTGRFNGVALVALEDSIVLARGYGLSDRETKQKNVLQTRFDIRSIGKQFTCVVVLQLVAENQLFLNDPILKHLPEYRADTGATVTIDQLLRHTSGIPCFLNDSHRRNPNRPVFDPTAEYSLEEFRLEFLSEDLLFEPESRYSYSNTGYYLLAMIAERVTGQRFEKLISERFLEPLEMTDSGTLSFSKKTNDLANGYVKSPWGYRRSAPWRPEYFKGAGGLYSTAEDLLRWNHALHTGQLLPAELMTLLREPYRLNPPPRHAYSVNHFTLRRSGSPNVPYTGFSGGGQGYSSDVLRFANGKVTVVLLDNTSQYNHWKIGPDIFDIFSGRTPSTPLPLMSEHLMHHLGNEGWQATLNWYQELNSPSTEYNQDSLERDLNTMGYSALSSDPSLAIEIFQLNAALHPDSWNTFDSLGDGQAAAGLMDESKSNFDTARFLQDRNQRLQKSLQENQWDVARQIIHEARKNNPKSQPLPDRIVGPIAERALAEESLVAAEQICLLWMESAPEAVGPIFTLCRVYRLQEDQIKLKQSYKKILEIDPENKYALASLAELKE